jgi:hypothetical protein
MCANSLDLPDLERIRDFLQERRFSYIEDIHFRTSDDTAIVYILETAIGTRVTKNTTSKRQLKYLQKAIKEELGINVEFLLHRGAEQDQLEADLNRLFKKNFGRIIRDSFISFPEHNSVEIWLDLEDVPLVRSRLQEDMVQTAIQYLELFDLKLAGLHLTGLGRELPSKIVILRAVKASAPSTIDDIKRFLESNGFAVPSFPWLNGKLDVLRKNKMLIRQEDGSYVMTEIGLRFVPHGAFRSSSDIERALVLGRKKW